jgi:phage terminase large subunit GpA-like protein
MAFIPAAVATRDGIITKSSQSRRRGIVRKILDAIIASQQRRAEAEIARFLRGRGNWLNDEIERRFLYPQRDPL